MKRSHWNNFILKNGHSTRWRAGFEKIIFRALVVKSPSGYIWQNYFDMGTLISRTEAAKILGCTPQTITNYVRYGILDEVHRQLPGRDGYYYDEDEVKALLPHLTELSELEARVAAKKEELLQEERRLEEARGRTRRQLVLVSGGEKTWNRLRELVVAAYAYAGKVKPPLEDMFDAKVLDAFLSLKSYEEASRELKAGRYKMDAAVSRICRRMLSIPNMKAELEGLRKENARLWEDNHLLQKAYEMQEAVNAVKKGVPADDAFLEGEAKKLLPLQNEHIATLRLSLRAEEMLIRVNIKSVFDLVGLTESDFARIARAKAPVIEEIKAALQARGLCFGMHSMNLSGLGHSYSREGNPFK